MNSSGLILEDCISAHTPTRANLAVSARVLRLHPQYCSLLRDCQEKNAVLCKISDILPHMATKPIEGYLCTCDRCGHTWKTIELPPRCAKCTTTAWNRPKERPGRKWSKEVSTSSPASSPPIIRQSKRKKKETAQ